jgi:hypothetical protein
MYIYIYNNFYVLYVLVDCWRATTRTNCCIYTLLPSDDGQLTSPKHVEIQWLNKLKINSASSWFHYTHISRCTFNKT